MKILEVILLKSQDCSYCEQLKQSLIRDFLQNGYKLKVQEYDILIDEQIATSIAIDNNISDIPSAIINGIVFCNNYPKTLVKAVIDAGNA